MTNERQIFNALAPAPIIPTEVFVELNPELQEFVATNYPQYIGPPKITYTAGKKVGAPGVYPYLPGSYPYYAAGITPPGKLPYYPSAAFGAAYPGYSYGAYPYNYSGYYPAFLPWGYNLYYQLWNSPNYQLMGNYPQYRPRLRPRRWCIPRPCFPL
jgi:hypothetical protein